MTLTDLKFRQVKTELNTHQISSQLIYLEAVNNYTMLHFKNNYNVISGYTLKVFQDILKDSTTTFKRIHRSHLVNMDYVRDVHHTKLQVLLKNGKYLKISRRRLAVLE